jgi:hypothetical protein
MQFQRDRERSIEAVSDRERQVVIQCLTERGREGGGTQREREGVV